MVAASHAGEKGEILLRGPTVMSGYIDAPELNRTAFVDGWFRTEDIGSFDEEGFLTLYGRVKEFINRGGEKIGPLEIDRALMRHPQIVEAAAYAVAHPRLGENVAAAVVLRSGAKVTQTDLRDFLSAQLAWFKIPRRIIFVDHLPKGPTGKVQRQRLAALSVELEHGRATARLRRTGFAAFYRGWWTRRTRSKKCNFGHRNGGVRRRRWSIGVRQNLFAKDSRWAGHPQLRRCQD